MNEMVGGPNIVTYDFQNDFNLVGRYHCISRTEIHGSKQHLLQDAEWRWLQPLYVQVTNIKRDSKAQETETVVAGFLHNVSTQHGFSFFFPQVCTQSIEGIWRQDC